MTMPSLLMTRQGWTKFPRWFIAHEAEGPANMAIPIVHNESHLLSQSIPLLRHNYRRDHRYVHSLTSLRQRHLLHYDSYCYKL